MVYRKVILLCSCFSSKDLLDNMKDGLSNLHSVD